MKKQSKSEERAKELMLLAEPIRSEELIDHKYALALDAHLRHVLHDIHPFWIRWGYVGEKQGWLPRSKEDMKEILTSKSLPDLPKLKIS